MLSSIVAIAGWSFIVGLIVAAFYCGWQDDRQHDLEAMERVEGRSEPWTVDELEEIWQLPAAQR